jgi:Rad3-related DNA helicase
MSDVEKSKPSDYGLRHEGWRPRQRESTDWGIELNGVGVMEAPTGSGKTAVARGVAEFRNTVALVRTKALQSENYDNDYQFDALYGRSNYPCVFSEARVGAMADECVFAEEGMHHCPDHHKCPYVVARDTAKLSMRSVLNYAYWLHVYNKWELSDMMVCDEGHQLSDITLQWAGISVDESTRRQYDLPRFPLIRSSGKGSVLLAAKDPIEDKALNWLVKAREALLYAYRSLSARAEQDPNARKRARQVELLGKKVRATIDAISSSPEDWYIISGPNAFEGRKGSTWGFVAKPLTAKHHFPRYFLRSPSAMIMSATIGDPDTFTKELGIKEFDFHRLESVWKPEVRPVHALDVPRLGMKSPMSAWNKQADEITRVIKSLDPSWHGLIHTTSKAEAGRLAERLSKRGLQDRVWVPPLKIGTEKLVRLWHEQMNMKTGQLLISWALAEGYDGTREKICISAKTPYPYLGSEYEKARQRYDGKYYLQRTAWTLEQSLGRVRRGREEDYDVNGVSKYVAIADGGFKWIRNYLSRSFMESLVIDSGAK